MNAATSSVTSEGRDESTEETDEKKKKKKRVGFRDKKVNIYTCEMSFLGLLYLWIFYYKVEENYNKSEFYLSVL